MRATIKKMHKGEIAASIEKTFTGAPALYQFLVEQGVRIEFRDCVDDLQLPAVVYTVPLLDVKVSHEYN